MIADRTAYDIRYCCKPLSGIAVHGQHQYLIIYNIKLKSVFDPCRHVIRSLFLLSAFSSSAGIRCLLWLNDTSYSKCPKKCIGSASCNVRILRRPRCPYVERTCMSLFWGDRVTTLASRTTSAVFGELHDQLSRKTCIADALFYYGN